MRLICAAQFQIAILSAIISIIFSGLSWAQDTQIQQALKMITDAAGQICQTVPLAQSSSGVKLSGNAQLRLGELIRQFADIGVNGVAEYQNQRSFGVLQQDLASAIRSSSDCKLQVFLALQEKLLSRRRTEIDVPSLKAEFRLNQEKTASFRRLLPSYNVNADQIRQLIEEQTGMVATQELRLRLGEGTTKEREEALAVIGRVKAQIEKARSILAEYDRVKSDSLAAMGRLEQRNSEILSLINQAQR